MPRKKRPKPPVGEAKFSEAQLLGKGAYGSVYRMKDITTQELVAVKQLQRGSQIDKYVYREMINHKHLVHRNIVQFKEVFLTDDHLSIVMEYAAGGDLLEYVNKYKREHGTALPEELARYFYDQILCGVGYMHQKGTCHRDLKLENVLLDSDGANPQETPTVKICDFGFSKSSRHSNPHSYVGTTCYCAPEILQARQGTSPYSGELSDVWSSGVLLYLMVVGDLPFGADEKGNFHVIQSRVAKGEYTIPQSSGISDNCRKLLAAILEVDPSKRINLKAIWEHPWMAEAGYQSKGPFEDEGAISSQTDEKITSLCLEAMNQGDEPEDGGGSGQAGAGPEDPMDIFDDAEFSNIIHMASEADYGETPEAGLPEGWNTEEMQELADLVPNMSIDCKDTPATDSGWRF